MSNLPVANEDNVRVCHPWPESIVSHDNERKEFVNEPYEHESKGGWSFACVVGQGVNVNCVEELSRLEQFRAVPSLRPFVSGIRQHRRWSFPTSSLGYERGGAVSREEQFSFPFRGEQWYLKAFLVANSTAIYYLTARERLTNSAHSPRPTLSGENHVSPSNSPQKFASIKVFLSASKFILLVHFENFVH